MLKSIPWNMPIGGARRRSGGLSGDLQGLSSVESANSESVDELLQEGNAFEADVIAGVEHADRASERGVRTREVPEDAFPKSISTRISDAGGCKVQTRSVFYFTLANSYRYSTYERTAPSIPRIFGFVDSIT